MSRAAMVFLVSDCGSKHKIYKFVVYQIHRFFWKDQMDPNRFQGPGLLLYKILHLRKPLVNLLTLFSLWH